MSGYNDVRFSSSTVSSGGGGSAWGSRSGTNSSERHAFVDDHDRTPVENNKLEIRKICFISCSVLTMLTVVMLLINVAGYGGNGNNSTNGTYNAT